jgi:hypothetical protein
MVGYIFTGFLVKLGLRPKELNDMPNQINQNPKAIAEPLSPYEYKSLATFFDLKYNEKKNELSS